MVLNFGQFLHTGCNENYALWFRCPNTGASSWPIGDLKTITTTTYYYIPQHMAAYHYILLHTITYHNILLHTTAYCYILLLLHNSKRKWHTGVLNISQSSIAFSFLTAGYLHNVPQQTECTTIGCHEFKSRGQSYSRHRT